MWTALAALVLAVAGYIGRLTPSVSPEPPEKPEEAPTTDPIELRLRLQEQRIADTAALAAEYRDRLCALEHQAVACVGEVTRLRAGKRAKAVMPTYESATHAWTCPATPEALENRRHMDPPNVAAEKALAP